MINKQKLNLIVKYLPISSIDLLIEIDKKILLVKRKKWPAQNKFTFVGGIIQKKQTFDNAIKKIMKRELGISFRGKKNLIGVEKFSFVRNFLGKKERLEYISQIYHIKISKKNKKKIKIDNDHSCYVCLSKNELMKNALVLNQIKKFLIKIKKLKIF